MFTCILRSASEKLNFHIFELPKNRDRLVLTSFTGVYFKVAFEANDLNRCVVPVDSIWWFNSQNFSAVDLGFTPSHREIHIGQTLSLLKSCKRCNFRICSPCSKIIAWPICCLHSWACKVFPLVPLKLNGEGVPLVDVPINVWTHALLSRSFEKWIFTGN